MYDFDVNNLISGIIVCFSAYLCSSFMNALNGEEESPSVWTLFSSLFCGIIGGSLVVTLLYLSLLFIETIRGLM